ncbi:2Fe-2S iron-sulfur cluster-binding protein [Nonomuraea recticatena]
MRRENGGRIDRGTTLRFTFDGSEYTGHPGDTLASALLANGVRQVATSVKLGRPRGIVSAGGGAQRGRADRGALPRADAARHHRRAVRRTGRHQPSRPGQAGHRARPRPLRRRPRALRRPGRRRGPRGPPPGRRPARARG